MTNENINAVFFTSKWKGEMGQDLAAFQAAQLKSWPKIPFF